jgi:hypothetical protein
VEYDLVEAQGGVKENVIPNDCIQSIPQKWTSLKYGFAESKNSNINVAYKKWNPNTPFENLLIEISLLVNNGDIIKNDIIIGINIKNGIDKNLSIYTPPFI